VIKLNLQNTEQC